ncbi:hypothetical protein J3R85_007799 [Psidium guajava]|nr:hypothetical protein J3R85_007799 [Psidium guajava]
MKRTIYKHRCSRAFLHTEHHDDSDGLGCGVESGSKSVCKKKAKRRRWRGKLRRLRRLSSKEKGFWGEITTGPQEFFWSRICNVGCFIQCMVTSKRDNWLTRYLAFNAGLN